MRTQKYRWEKIEICLKLDTVVVIRLRYIRLGGTNDVGRESAAGVGDVYRVGKQACSQAARHSCKYYLA